ncbi:MAG: putative immunity protein [Bacteroidota bacterium]
MRDKHFIRIERGGLLSREQHYLMMKWACACAEHVLFLCENSAQQRLIMILNIANQWKTGKATVGEARNAALEAIKLARESDNRTIVAVTRSVGHAVATAHMADHALRAADYALKAIKTTNNAVETERIWQNEQLDAEIAEIISNARNK